MTKKIIITSLVVMTFTLFVTTIYLAKNKPYYKIDLENLTVEKKDEKSSIKTYSQDDYLAFYQDYQNNLLPDVYITKFVFDGVSMYKAYDLDDFIEKGNDYDPKALSITNINIHSNGNYELKGKIEDAMISVNTNDVTGKISLLLNNARIDTKSKKVPVIYVYNKDVNYTNVLVYIKAMENTHNYLEGGKFNKTSLIAKEDYEDLSSRYINQANYSLYANYYSLYSKKEIENVLFAKVTASEEDLKGGDPYYFYKGSGAISSDIDLYFEGEGYLEVKSKNNEGIETKGNLSLIGGIGDYVVESFDDCLNTTSEDTNAHNTMLINVQSLYAVVSSEADEGDALDSNGEIYIDGGRIVAIAKEGSDAGIDSGKGTYINGGEVLATGDMYDQIMDDSKQRVMVLSFDEKQENGDILVLTSIDQTPIMAYKTDRTFQNFIYSSSNLEDKTYYLYEATEINGYEEFGLYQEIASISKKNALGYASKMLNDMRGGMNQKENPDNKHNEIIKMPPEEDFRRKPMNSEQENKSLVLNKEFAITERVNIFSGIATYND